VLAQEPMNVQTRDTGVHHGGGRFGFDELRTHVPRW
jgi:hypothetical protein